MQCAGKYCCCDCFSLLINVTTPVFFPIIAGALLVFDYLKFFMESPCSFIQVSTASLRTFSVIVHFNGIKAANSSEIWRCSSDSLLTTITCVAAFLRIVVFKSAVRMFSLHSVPLNTIATGGGLFFKANDANDNQYTFLNKFSVLESFRPYCQNLINS